MTKTVDADEGKLLHREQSPTAASASDRKFPPSGAQVYRAMVQTAMGLVAIDVEASTGDEAAELALKQAGLGAKVTNITPAPKKAG